MAGSDFPANIGRFDSWPLAFPLLGPERALVKAAPGESAYEAWAAGVRKGAVVISNGPLLDFAVQGRAPGEVIRWDGDAIEATGVATGKFHRPIERLEIVANGRVVASREGGDGETELSLPFQVSLPESAWVAARAQARHNEGEPEIWAHANPVYLLQDGSPVYIKADRRSCSERWEKEAEYYRNSELVFAEESQRRELLEMVEDTRKICRSRRLRWRAQTERGPCGQGTAQRKPSAWLGRRRDLPLRSRLQNHRQDQRAALA